MAIDINKPVIWSPMFEGREARLVNFLGELGPIFRLITLAGVHEKDADLLLDQEGRKMLRVHFDNGSLMYGPLVFKQGKVFAVVSVFHEYSASDGRKLVNPYREVITVSTEVMGPIIKGDIRRTIADRSRGKKEPQNLHNECESIACR